MKTKILFCALSMALSSALTTVPSHAAGWDSATLAGTGVAGYGGDGGPAAQAQLNDPTGLVRGPDGSLFICEANNHVIRRIAPDNTISTIAGTGKRGYSGDGGPATQAQLNEPYEVRFDQAGNMFFVERLNHLVRRVDAKTNIISTVAGTGKSGFGGDGGPATQAQLNEPHSLQFGPDGNLYIADVLNHRVRHIDMKTGVISTLAGNGQKAATPDGARFEGVPLSGPRALDFDADGNLWLALREGNAIYKFDMAKGTIHRVAGNGKKGFTGNGGPARDALLSGPKGLSIGMDGGVYFADTESHSIRMIDREGKMHLVAGTGEKGDGPGGNSLMCKLNRPHGIFIAKDGQIYIGDSTNNRVRVLRSERTGCPCDG